MMEEKNIGWIKLGRKITSWGWYKDSNTFRVFMHLLLTANWEPSEYQGHKVGRGEVVIGVNALSTQIGISVQATRTSLKKLEKTGEINKRSTNKFSIVSICNYDTYQSKESDSNKPITNEQQTSNKRATTSKEVKKERSNVSVEKNCEEQQRKIIFQKNKGYFNGREFDKLWEKFVWVCEQNGVAFTETRWNTFTKKK
jgi:hypothetical protein